MTDDEKERIMLETAGRILACMTTDDRRLATRGKFDNETPYEAIAADALKRARALITAYERDA